MKSSLSLLKISVPFWEALFAFLAMIFSIGLGIAGAYLFQWIVKVFIWDGSFL